MIGRQWFAREICICLPGDTTGFLYRVRRFGLFGRRHFVSAAETENRSRKVEESAVLRSDARQDHNK